MRDFYNTFVKPRSKHVDQAEREVVLNYLLLGIISLSLIALLDALLQLTVSHDQYLTARILGIGGALIFFIALYAGGRYRDQVRSAAVVLTFFTTAVACFLDFRWGLLVPTGIALLCLAIVMAGILVSARYAFYTAAVIVVVMSCLQYAQSRGTWHPDSTWMKHLSTSGDVIGFAAIFFTIAWVSWLYNRQMELSLKRARRSERALQQQKVLLEIKVEKRAQELEAAQLEKMQELYRFAELGRLSTALFHDLANHLSTVSLEIEGLSEKGQSDIMQRISQNIGHIDTIVKRVRQQIRGKSVVEVFAVLDEISEVVKILSPAAEQAKVSLEVISDASVKPGLSYKGDPIRFRQIILNLISNGIEAYPETRARTIGNRTVTVHLSRQQTALLIEVTDHGLGVAKKERSKIFRPFYTTKNKGVGIGLFIVRQVVENDFKGTLDLKNSNKEGTTFSVSLPKSYYAKNRN